MEKCTYCVQRISRARRAAEKENRPIAEGEVTTACQGACPTRAIVFGDLNNPGEVVRELQDASRATTRCSATSAPARAPPTWPTCTTRTPRSTETAHERGARTRRYPPAHAGSLPGTRATARSRPPSTDRS